MQCYVVVLSVPNEDDPYYATLEIDEVFSTRVGAEERLAAVLREDCDYINYGWIKEKEVR